MQLIHPCKGIHLKSKNLSIKIQKQKILQISRYLLTITPAQ